MCVVFVGKSLILDEIYEKDRRKSHRVTTKRTVFSGAFRCAPRIYEGIVVNRFYYIFATSLEPVY